MVEFFFQNKIILILVLLVLIFILFEWQRSKTILYALMLQAKRYAKDAILKSGREQEDWVVKRAMIFLPVSIRIFLSEEVLRVIIHDLFTALKDYIDDGEFNSSIRQ